MSAQRLRRWSHIAKCYTNILCLLGECQIRYICGPRLSTGKALVSSKSAGCWLEGLAQCWLNTGPAFETLIPYWANLLRLSCSWLEPCWGLGHNTTLWNVYQSAGPKRHRGQIGLNANPAVLCGSSGPSQLVNCAPQYPHSIHPFLLHEQRAWERGQMTSFRDLQHASFQ